MITLLDPQPILSSKVGPAFGFDYALSTNCLIGNFPRFFSNNARDYLIELLKTCRRECLLSAITDIYLSFFFSHGKMEV